jgi:hypothetical protein
MSRAQHYFRVLIESALPVLDTNFNVLLSDECAAHPPRLTPFPAPNLNILHLPKHYQVRSSPCRVHNLEIIFDLIHDILIRVVLYIINKTAFVQNTLGEKEGKKSGKKKIGNMTIRRKALARPSSFFLQ